MLYWCRFSIPNRNRTYRNSSKFRNFWSAENYDIYRCGREGRCGGGTLIAVSQTMPSFQVNLAADLEMVWVCITFRNMRALIGVCYRPPNSLLDFFNSLHYAVQLHYFPIPILPAHSDGTFQFAQHYLLWSCSYCEGLIKPVPAICGRVF